MKCKIKPFVCLNTVCVLMLFLHSCMQTVSENGENFKLEQRSCDSAEVVLAVRADTNLSHFHTAFENMAIGVASSFPNQDSLGLVFLNYPETSNPFDFCNSSHVQDIAHIKYAVRYAESVCKVIDLQSYFKTTYPCLQTLPSTVSIEALHGTMPDLFVSPNSLQ